MQWLKSSRPYREESAAGPSIAESRWTGDSGRPSFLSRTRAHLAFFQFPLGAAVAAPLKQARVRVENDEEAIGRAAVSVGGAVNRT